MKGCCILSNVSFDQLRLLCDFIFHFINVYHTYLFMYVEQCLHLTNKYHLINMYDTVNVLLNSVC